MLGYYDDPILHEIYKGWRVEKHQTFKQVVGGQNLGADAEELLLMNFEIKQLSIFDY